MFLLHSAQAGDEKPHDQDPDHDQGEARLNGTRHRACIDYSLGGSGSRARCAAAPQGTAMLIMQVLLILISPAIGQAAPLRGVSVVSLESATRSEPSPKAGWKPKPALQDAAARQVVTLESASRSAPSPKAGWKPRAAGHEEEAADEEEKKDRKGESQREKAVVQKTAAADTSKKEEKKDRKDKSHEEEAVVQKTAAADTSKEEEKKDGKDKSNEEEAVGQKTAVAADTSKEEEKKDRKDEGRKESEAFAVHVR